MRNRQTGEPNQHRRFHGFAASNSFIQAAIADLALLISS
jgi:hypothetical protein